MYVLPTHALANQLRAATYLIKDKNLIVILKDAAERLEDLDKIAEHYRAKAEEKQNEQIYNAGYRKASDVINEVEQFIFIKYGEYFNLSELKKKYTESEKKQNEQR